jgi:hypothetical protein
MKSEQAVLPNPCLEEEEEEEENAFLPHITPKNMKFMWSLFFSECKAMWWLYEVHIHFSVFFCDN